MKKFSVKGILLPVLSLLLICAVATALLALTNKVTAPKIAENDAEVERQAQMLVLPEAESFESKTVSVGESELSYAEGLDKSGEVVGYVFVSASNGYGGEVSVMTGRNTKGLITGIEVLSCDDETPGLGQNAKKEEWREQFKGLDGDISVVKDAAENGEIQAITSATITSTAVTAAVNATFEIYNAITQGGEKNG